MSTTAAIVAAPPGVIAPLAGTEVTAVAVLQEPVRPPAGLPDRPSRMAARASPGGFGQTASAIATSSADPRLAMAG